MRVRWTTAGQLCLLGPRLNNMHKHLQMHTHIHAHAFAYTLAHTRTSVHTQHLVEDMYVCAQYAHTSRHTYTCLRAYVCIGSAQHISATVGRKEAGKNVRSPGLRLVLHQLLHSPEQCFHFFFSRRFATSAVEFCLCCTEVSNQKMILGGGGGTLNMDLDLDRGLNLELDLEAFSTTAIAFLCFHCVCEHLHRKLRFHIFPILGVAISLKSIAFSLARMLKK